MQTAGAYVEQIPAGAKPPPASPPALKIAPNAHPVAARPPPAGLYVQLASASSQEDALKAGLEISQRLGVVRPPFIQGVTEMLEGRPRILLFGGPFPDAAAAQSFCALALPGRLCQVRPFGSGRPEAARPAPDPRPGD